MTHVPVTLHYYGISGAKGPRPAPQTGNYPTVSTTTNYDTNHGSVATSGILFRNSNTGMRDILDGTSNTFLVGESSRTPTSSDSGYRAWTQGASNGNNDVAVYACKNVRYGIGPGGYISDNVNFLFNDRRMGSNHTGGAHFLMADGAVKFVSENIDFTTYQAAASKDEGLVVTLE